MIERRKPLVSGRVQQLRRISRIPLHAEQNVKRTGAKANIAGYDAEQVSIITKQSCKSRKTGSVCDIALVFDHENASAG